MARNSCEESGDWGDAVVDSVGAGIKVGLYVGAAVLTYVVVVKVADTLTGGRVLDKKEGDKKD